MLSLNINAHSKRLIENKKNLEKLLHYRTFFLYLFSNFFSFLLYLFLSFFSGLLSCFFSLLGFFLSRARHPRKPFEKAILVEDEPRKMMLASISLAEEPE